MLSKSRYEGRRMFGTPIMFGVWDTFTQTFVKGEAFSTISEAIRAAGRTNGAYERAMG